jgi:serine/threonine protein kinase HipA of HipAB toxin-antitoxin module
MISLKSIDSEYTGKLSNWPKVINALLRKKMVSLPDVYNVELLWLFGCLINNTDMHLGNLSFAIDGNVFRLLPVYDMCSMGFAPKSGGEVLPYDFTPALSKITVLTNDFINNAKEMAHDFWEGVTKDRRISEEFRTFLNKGNPIDLLLRNQV